MTNEQQDTAAAVEDARDEGYPSAMFIKCKVCGWDLREAMGPLEGAVWPSPAVMHQASITYTIFAAHMQLHIYDALCDIDYTLGRMGKLT
mgnify:CR=1 FL=1